MGSPNYITVLTPQNDAVTNIEVTEGATPYDINVTTNAGAAPYYIEIVEGRVSKVSIGLGNVDNTSDLNKPLSYAVISALELKTDFTTFIILSSFIDFNSYNWTEAFTNLVTNSGYYLSGSDTSLIQGTSANWEATYNIVQANSSYWNSVYSFVNQTSSIGYDQNVTIFVQSNSSIILDVDTMVQTNSSIWGNTGSNVSSLSANWENTYTIVQDFSSNWQSSFTTVETNSSYWGYEGTDLKSLSANWQTAYTNLVTNSAFYLTGVDLSFLSVSSHWDSTYTTVQSNSSLWGYEGTDLKALSAYWQEAYTNLVTNSAFYLTGVDLSLIQSTSAQWNSVYSFINATSSSEYNQIAATTFVLNNSANILSVDTLVNTNFANWSYQGTDLKSLSANWDSTFTTVHNNSAYWTDAKRIGTIYENVSSSYATIEYSENKFFPLSGGVVTGFTTFLSSVIINGNVTIGGNLTAAGNVTFANTIFTTTSALSVVNFGPGPALYINQTLAPYNIAEFFGGNSPVFHIGTPEIIDGLGKVGVNTLTPNYELTVKGSISATRDFITDGNVDAWTATLGNTDAPSRLEEFIPFSVIGSSDSSVFCRFQNLTQGLSSSADIAIFSDADDDGDNYIDIGINNSAWDGNLFYPPFNNSLPNDAYIYSQSSNLVIGTNSAGYGDLIFYTGGTLSGTDAFGGNDRLRIRNTGNVGINENNPSERLTVNGSISSSYIIYGAGGNSLLWNSVYSDVSINSAVNWNYQGTDIKSLSSNWDSVFTTVKSNSAVNWNYQGTDIKSLSSNWDSVFTTVKSNSAVNWNYQGTDLKSLSANWDSAFTTLQKNSASYCSIGLAAGLAIALG